MMSGVERDGSRTKLRLKQLEPPLDMALRDLQLTCGKRHRPVMMDRLEKENRIGMAIDEIPDRLLPFACSAQVAADVEHSKQSNQQRELLLGCGSCLSQPLGAKIGLLGFRRRPPFGGHQRRTKAGLDREFAPVPLG